MFNGKIPYLFVAEYARRLRRAQLVFVRVVHQRFASVGKLHHNVLAHVVYFPNPVPVHDVVPWSEAADVLYFTRVYSAN